jgi:phosphoglycolate phosphatase
MRHEHPFEAVIFDLDGTLLDTLSDIAVAANKALGRQGFPSHGVEEYRYFVGDGVTMLMRRALPPQKRHDDAIIAACVDLFREEYGRTWDLNTRAYEGIPELLDTLTGKGMKMAVFSNKPDDFTKRYVDRFFQDWFFEIVLGLRQGMPKKPDPAGAIQIAGHLRITPPRFLYLGDSGVDMKTAVNAGMFPVGALWGFRTREELVEHGAGATIEHPMELLDCLDLS